MRRSSKVEVSNQAEQCMSSIQAMELWSSVAGWLFHVILSLYACRESCVLCGIYSDCQTQSRMRQAPLPFGLFLDRISSPALRPTVRERCSLCWGVNVASLLFGGDDLLVPSKWTSDTLTSFPLLRRKRQGWKSSPRPWCSHGKVFYTSTKGTKCIYCLLDNSFDFQQYTVYL